MREGTNTTILEKYDCDLLLIELLNKTNGQIRKGTLIQDPLSDHEWSLITREMMLCFMWNCFLKTLRIIIELTTVLSVSEIYFFCNLRLVPLKRKMSPKTFVPQIKHHPGIHQGKDLLRLGRGALAESSAGKERAYKLI